MERLKQILSGQGKELKVLDIGTGLGDFICELQECLPGYSSIIGIDTTESTVNRAKGNFKDKRIEFMCMDGEDLKFQDNSMDIVAISNTLHHLHNKEKVLNEIKRVLKDNGLIIINEMISDNQSEKQLSHVKLHHFHAEIDTLRGICHNRTFTKRELIKMVEDLKFEKVSLFEYGTYEEQLSKITPEEEKKCLNQWFQAISSALEKIHDLPQYDEYLEKSENLKGKLYEVGYFNATEVMLVYRKG
ncbi:Methyltransferase domain-containing protein [Clostridium cavendishii DSM 21758]|uniref:Methyltransferase domain-containing protein n=1 Tax=Clostridium cavendishii DSM 21758 TaxID=1121302 RepID=A0A1M6GEP8_9CLOT|nr:class I SAM-dependent methyltransferase [Clostridium cavendishii]SHJ08397.1 Methyltransferase domain-containing protein [Clostridium cavendishii DSM 21758]